MFQVKLMYWIKQFVLYSWATRKCLYFRITFTQNYVKCARAQNIKCLGHGKDELAEDKHPIDGKDEIFLFTLCH